MKLLWKAHRRGMIKSTNFTIRDSVYVLPSIADYYLYGVVVGKYFIGYMRKK
jgi:hypothetical protein